MKLVHTEISRLTNELLSIEPIIDPTLQCPFHSQPEYHSHPEVELLYIIEGKGMRVVHGIAENFESGDMVFMGPGVPHIWVNDEIKNPQNDSSPKAILVYFNIFKFQELFNSVKEFSAIKKLINDGRKGIKITGKTRDTIGNMLLELHNMRGYPQLEGILRILHIISVSEERTFIASNLNEPEEQEIS
ncbi:MAG: cupin domain-containing protein, partial [Chitinophagaceae bacterium]|nr:cupin domain-containing protein [Chitinophagaceae bacterium]